MLHHHNAPSTCRRVVVRESGRLLAHHHWLQLGHKSPTIRHDGGVPHAQVAAATVDAALLRATVVVADAFAFGASELVELLEVLGQGGISQITRWGSAQSAEFVVRRLETGVEEGRIKVISADDVFLARLFDLDDDRDDEQDDNQTTGNSNDSEVGVIQIIQDARFPLLFAVILVPRVNAVLDAIADQGVVDAHVTMAKESFSLTRWFMEGCKEDFEPALPAPLVCPQSHHTLRGKQHDIIGHSGAELIL